MTARGASISRPSHSPDTLAPARRVIDSEVAALRELSRLLDDRFAAAIALLEQVKGRVYGCVFDDLHGLINRDAVGTDHILWETDYPHSDGTFPHSRKIAHELFTAAGMNAEECRMVLRSNAVKAYGLDRFGVTP